MTIEEIQRARIQADLPTWTERKPGQGPDRPAILTSVTPKESTELRRLAKNKRVAEIGTAFGYATIVMAKNSQYVVSADPHEWLDSYKQAVQNVEAWGVSDKVSLRIGAAQDVFNHGERFDLVFVDGDHSGPHVQADLVLAMGLLGWPAHGTLAFHDYNDPLCPDVAPVLDAAFSDGPTRVVDSLYVKEV